MAGSSHTLDLPDVQTVSLPAVMKRYLYMNEKAIDCAFSHGQVFLGERRLGNAERVMAYEPVRGQVLEVAGRSIRLGSRPLPPAQPSLFD